MVELVGVVVGFCWLGVVRGVLVVLVVFVFGVGGLVLGC